MFPALVRVGSGLVLFIKSPLVWSEKPARPHLVPGRLHTYYWEICSSLFRIFPEGLNIFCLFLGKIFPQLPGLRFLYGLDGVPLSLPPGGGVQEKPPVLGFVEEFVSPVAVVVVAVPITVVGQ